MSVLIAYFSWTGNTKTVAEKIKDLLKNKHKVREVKIEPVKDLPYPLWLILSFIPESRVKIALTGEIGDPDCLFLGTPKWTFSCPPVNSFLDMLEWRGDVYLFITCGGFDEVRYANSLRNKIENLGLKVKDVLIIKRKLIQEGRYGEIVSDFLKRNGFI